MNPCGKSRGKAPEGSEIDPAERERWPAPPDAPRSLEQIPEAFRKPLKPPPAKVRP